MSVCVHIQYMQLTSDGHLPYVAMPYIHLYLYSLWVSTETLRGTVEETKTATGGTGGKKRLKMKERGGLGAAPWDPSVCLALRSETRRDRLAVFWSRFNTSVSVDRLSMGGVSSIY